jgi:hypothetical protein
VGVVDLVVLVRQEVVAAVLVDLEQVLLSLLSPELPMLLLLVLVVLRGLQELVKA